MDALVCVVWSVALLLNTLSLKGSSASVPASTAVSLNDAVDLFVTSRMTDPKEPIRMDLSHPPSSLQHISSTSTERDKAQGASTTSLPTLTPILTTNHVNTKITDSNKPNTGATIGTDAVWPPNATQGSLDTTPSLIPLRSTTVTQGSPIPSSTNVSEEHQNSSQSTTSETIPTIYLIPPSTLKDLVTGSASLGKENQDGPSELDVGDEDSVPSPSPLDPLLAGLISIFIISTALLSIILFLKFRQTSGHPEFHRLQDLPMDDLLEDTPLSRYAY